MFMQTAMSETIKFDVCNLVDYNMNCIRHMQNVTFETGLSCKVMHVMSSNIGTDQPFFLGRRKGTAGRRKPP